MPLPRIRAAELMTENLRTVRVDDPIGEAADVLQTTDFRHLLPVDEQGELVGMLSDRDLRALQLPCSADTAVARRALGRRRREKARCSASSAMWTAFAGSSGRRDSPSSPRAGRAQGPELPY